MLIHLAETSDERGQYKCLVKEQFINGLLSYAYRRTAISGWESAWGGLVNIHLAGQDPFTYDCKKQENVESVLTTYAHLQEVKGNEKMWNEMDLRPRVIIDSGAFTAWTSGKQINPKDYAQWALDFDKRWRHKMASLEFMNLDVIGDQDASWKNQSLLESLGMSPLPIVTYGVDLSHVDRALENYPYMALGGLVPYTRQKDKLQKWLDACFSRVMAYRKKTGILRKVHLLGVTTDWVLKRYPCYSSDSSSWVSCLRFGGASAAGIKQIPRYKESDGAMAATIHTLRAEIRKFKKMQDEATKLWEKRGITFEE